jgi:hypothetical protein
MKVDLYTKAVLTIIALCLVWICVRGTFAPQPVQAAAAPAVQDVKLVGIDVFDPYYEPNKTLPPNLARRIAAVPVSGAVKTTH